MKAKPKPKNQSRKKKGPKIPLDAPIPDNKQHKEDFERLLDDAVFGVSEKNKPA